MALLTELSGQYSVFVLNIQRGFSMQLPMALPTELSGLSSWLQFAAKDNKWCRLSELNGWPTDYKSVALPTELSRHTKFVFAVHYNHFKRDYQIMVPRGGIEPPTRGFSILCSTDWAIWAIFCFCAEHPKRIFNATPNGSTDWAIWAIFCFCAEHPKRIFNATPNGSTNWAIWA